MRGLRLCLLAEKVSGDEYVVASLATFGIVTDARTGDGFILAASEAAFATVTGPRAGDGSIPMCIEARGSINDDLGCSKSKCRESKGEYSEELHCEG